MELKPWLEAKHGRALALARALKVPPSFISKLGSGEKQVPLEQCVPIERFTECEVTCEEMRPDKAADFAYLRGQESPSEAVNA